MSSSYPQWYCPSFQTVTMKVKVYDLHGTSPKKVYIKYKLNDSQTKRSGVTSVIMGGVGFYPKYPKEE